MENITTPPVAPVAPTTSKTKEEKKEGKEKKKKAYPCCYEEGCSKSYDDSNQLERHIARKHTGSSHVICKAQDKEGKICGIKFDDKDDWMKHAKKAKHRGIEQLKAEMIEELKGRKKFLNEVLPVIADPANWGPSDDEE